MKKNYARRAVRSLSIVFISGILVSFLAYLLRVGLAKTLDLTEFGLFFAVLSLVLLVLTFRDIGLRNASVKFIAHYMARKSYRHVKSVILVSLLIQGILSLLLTLAFLLGAHLLAAYYFHTPDATMLVQTLAALFISNFLFMNSRSILRGFQDMTWFSLADPVRIITIIGVFAALFFGEYTSPVMSAAVAYISGDVAGFLVMLIPLAKYRHILARTGAGLRSTAKEMIAYSLPVMFTGIGEKVLGYFDIVLLTTLASLEAVGIYNVVLPSALFFLALTSATTTVIFPLVSELWSKKDDKRIREGLRVLYRYILAIVMPAILAIGVFAELFLRVMFAPEFTSGARAFQILLAGVAFFVVSKINYAALSAIDRPGTVTKITLLTGAVNIVLNILLIPSLGVEGAALATALSFILTFILSSTAIIRLVHLRLPLLSWIATLGASGLFVVIVAYLKNSINLWWPLEVAIAVIPAGLAYLLAIFVMRVVRRDELHDFLRHLLPSRPSRK